MSTLLCPCLLSLDVGGSPSLVPLQILGLSLLSKPKVCIL